MMTILRTNEGILLSRISRAAALGLITCLLTLGCCCLAMAQERLVVEGIIDGEIFRTDFHSDASDPSEIDVPVIGRLQLWSAAQISAGLQLYALVEAESLHSAETRETELELEQFALRYTSGSDLYYYIEAGKFLSPFSTFFARNLSTQNPLIGQPVGDYSAYPMGIQVAGSSGWFDFRAAAVDLPATQPGSLLAEPDSAMHLELGFGVTPMIGLRLGVSYSGGPYLNRGVSDFLPVGKDWKDFDQQLLGLDFQFSRGYAELNGAAIFSRYGVPNLDQKADYRNFFLELKYTWTPRLFSALRVQRAEYPLIGYMYNQEWQAQSGTIHDFEVGLGYRLSPRTVVKVAYRHEDWKEDGVQGNFYPSGRSLGLQLSHQFDIRSWFESRP